MATRPEEQDQSLKQALVVGGQHGFVKEKLSKSLARHGVRIHTHWSWDKKRPPQVFPHGIDLVYICTDMVGHGLSVPCMDWARDTGIPYVNGTRKWAESIVRLTQGGFPLLDPLKSVPEIVEEIRRTRSSQQMNNGPNEEELHALAVAFTGDVQKASELVAVYNDATGLVELPMDNTTVPLIPSITTEIALPENTPMPSTDNVHLSITNPKQREYLRALAFNPDSDNVALWRDLENLPLFTGAKFDPERASYARKSLGINITRKGGMRVVTVNTSVFATTMKMAKIEVYPAPQAVYKAADNAFKTQTPAVAPAPAPVAAPAPVVAAPLPVAAPAPAPTPVVPVVVTSEKWPNADFKDLLALMREHMAVHNIKALTITEAGVSFKRIEIVEGDLAI
jgi:hypothetical protein